MGRLKDHIVLVLAAVIMGGPLLMVLVGATQPGGLQPGLPAQSPLDGLMSNIARLDRLTGRDATGPTLGGMLATSLATGLGVALLSTALGFLTAYAMVFTPSRAARAVFWLTVLTLYFPIEARMLHTFDVAVAFGLINSLAGLILPILPLALSTLILLQHMRGLPPELLEAARLDGAGPFRFLWDFVLPLSLVPIGAVLVVTFLAGWNQYLWPLMISVDNSLFPLMRGLNLAGTGSGPSLVIAALSVLPPIFLVLGLVRVMSRVTAARP